MRDVYRTSVVVLNAQQVSAAFRPGAFSGGSIGVPNPVDGINLTYEVSDDGVVWNALEDAGGAAIANTPYVAGENIPIRPEVFNYDYARLRTNVVVTANRTFSIFLKE